MSKKPRSLLFGNKDVYENSKENDDLFLETMISVLKFHEANNEFFNKFLKTCCFKIDSLSCIDDLYKVPPVHAFLFKTHKLFSVSAKDAVVKRSSSGTSGQKSFMIFDKETLSVNGDMNTNIFNYFGLFSNELTNYIMFSYEVDEDSILSTACTDNFLRKR